MPPSHTSLSLWQGASYLPARGNVVVGVPCFGGPHGRRQRTGRTGPPKHATLGYVTFPFAACYLAPIFLLREERESRRRPPAGELEAVPGSGRRAVEGHQHRPQRVVRAVDGQ